MPGRLIVFEGIDGAGKSTHAEMLRGHLAGRGVSVALHREPGGTRLGEDVRKILLGHRDDDMTVESEFLLYMAARAQLLEEAVRPALRTGGTVILDRYYHSTAAYQGAGRGLGVAKVLDVCGRLGFDRPDHVFLLDLDPEEAFERLPQGKDRIEARGLEYFKAVREGFLELARREKDRFTLLDAAQPVKVVQMEVRGIADGL